MSKNLVNAYQQWMERVNELTGGQKLTLDQALDQVSDEAKAAGNLTEEQVDAVIHYLSRDMHDVAKYIEDSQSPLEDWLRYDASLAEGKLFETFMSVADKTRVQLDTFQGRLIHHGEYLASEVTGLGTLQCDACGTLQHFYEPSVIAPCANCSEKTFTRVMD